MYVAVSSEPKGAGNHGCSHVVSLQLIFIFRRDATTALPVACPHMGQHGRFGLSPRSAVGCFMSEEENSCNERCMCRKQKQQMQFSTSGGVLVGVIAPELGRCNAAAAAAGTFFVQEEPQTAAAAAANNRFCVRPFVRGSD